MKPRREASGEREARMRWYHSWLPNRAMTTVTSQAAVAGITLAVISVAPMIAAFLPDPTLMPTSILDWTVKLGVGEPVNIVSPFAWALTVTALVVFSLRRMERIEL